MAAASLRGRVALVTGAGTRIGLGRHIALALAREGARVAMLDINESGLEQAAADVRAAPEPASVLPLIADVTDPDAVEQAVARTLAELGGLDIVFNNAGTNPVHAGLASAEDGNRAWEISVPAWQRVVGVNLSGPFYVMRAVVPHLVAQGWGGVGRLVEKRLPDEALNGRAGDREAAGIHRPRSFRAARRVCAS